MKKEIFKRITLFLLCFSLILEPIAPVFAATVSSGTKKETIDSFAFYDGDGPYATYTISYSERNSVESNYLPSEMEVFIDDEVKEIPVTWSPDSNYSNKNKYSFTFSASIDETKYKLGKNAELPYVNFNVTKTITSLANYENGANIGTYTANFDDKESVLNELPKTIDVYINEQNSPTSIEVEWECDYFSSFRNSYEFTSKPKDSIKIKDGVVFPTLTVKLSNTITTFNKYSGTGAFISARLFPIEKETFSIDETFTKAISVYINGIEEEVILDVSWKIEEDVRTSEKNYFKFPIVLPNGYSVSKKLQPLYCEVTFTENHYVVSDWLQYESLTNVWDGSTPYMTIETDYSKKTEAHLNLPDIIQAVTTDERIVDLGVEWTCADDIQNTRKDVYRYVAKLNDDDLVFEKQLSEIYAEIKVDNNGIVSFVNYDGTNPYQTYSIDYASKNMVTSKFPSTIQAYFGNDKEPTTIGINWYCNDDLLNTDNQHYEFYAVISDEFLLSNTLENEYKNNIKALPYIKVTINDFGNLSANLAEFNFKATTQIYKAPSTGKYFIKAYGASGSGVSSSANGYGGFVSGYINLKKGDTLYIYTGGAGTGSSGGYNGGASAASGAGGSGGATHISKNNDRGLLSNYAEHLDEIIVIAAGGGGIGSSGYSFRSIGGGGGLTGQVPQNTSGTNMAQAATQTSGYAFGKGQAGINGGGAGGAGLYGGYTSGNSQWGGSGGSSFLENLYDATTLGGINEGNGYVEISYVGDVVSELRVETNGAGTWNGQNGTVIAETKKAGTKITIPNPVGLYNFEFTGWSVIEGDGTIEGNVFTYGEKNTILKANWSRILYLENTLNWNGFSGTGSLDLNWQQDNINSGSEYMVYTSTDGINWNIIGEDGLAANNVSKTPITYGRGKSTYTIPITGYYYLELYGGRGGYDGGHPGMGGGIKVKMFFKKGQVLHIYVAGKGDDSYTAERGGYNGGGDAGSSGASGGGGGATHVFLDYDNNFNYRIAAAGGGGGANNVPHHDYGRPGGEVTDTSYTGAGWRGGCPGGADGGGGGAGWRGGSPGYDGGTRAGGGTNGYITSVGGFNLRTELVWSKAGVKDGNGIAYVTPYMFLPTIMDNKLTISTPDTKAPNAPTNAYVKNTDGTNTVVTWSIPVDNGLTYYNKVVSVDPTTGVQFETSNITTNYIESGVSHYAYYIDGNETGIINKSNISKMTTVDTNELYMVKTTAKQYLHIVAVDSAGNISNTYNYEIPIIYYLQYNSNVSTNTSMKDEVIRDKRAFAFGTTYGLNLNAFTKEGIGYYNQKLTYNFVGWGFKPFSSYSGSYEKNPYHYKSNVVYKVPNFMTGTPSMVPQTTLTNPLDRIYYTENDVFSNLTNINGTIVDLYAEWIADNQKPYGGFTFKALVFNDDGTSSGKLKDVPYDAYDVENRNDISKTIILYDDGVYFLNTQYRDPEGNVCTADYQYSIDDGATWYKVQTSILDAHKKFLNIKTYSTKSGNLLGITFEEDTQVMIRMRLKDTPTYTKAYVYNRTTKSYEIVELQKSMWSTGYFVDNSHNDYDSTGKYLGDYGQKGNQGGTWYTKIINTYVGNNNPISNLVADYLDVSTFNGDYSFENIMKEVRKQNFFNFPMYDYTNKDESYNYSDGMLYFLVSNGIANKYEKDTDILKHFYDKNNKVFAYLKNTDTTLIKEDNYQYTIFNPEDESVAFLNASYDVDNEKHTNSPTSNIDKVSPESYYKKGSVVGNDSFSHYWITICESGTNKNVLTNKNDVASTYNDLDLSSGTLYTKTINGVQFVGLVYDTYEEMVKDIYDRSGSLFATRGDNEINVYDVYFSVCDKSWNLVSPNKWGNVTKKTLIVEPRLSFYDVQFKDKQSTITKYVEYISIYRNGANPYYYIGNYTLLNGKYKNIDSTFDDNSNAISTLKTLNDNANANYVINSENNFVSSNGNIPINCGYNLDFLIKTHGNEVSTVQVYNADGNIIEIVPSTIDEQVYGNVYANKTLTTKETRKGLNEWHEISEYCFNIPEHETNRGFYVKVSITKTPYTNKANPLTRTIFLGDKDNLLLTTSDSVFNDVGVSLVN